MRFGVVAVMLSVAVGRADAQVIQAGGAERFAGPVTIETIEPVGNNPFNRGLTTRTAVLDSRSGLVVPTVTRLHPVIGSVQRTNWFTNPLTQKDRYTGTVYNPQLGQFSTYRFRR